MWSVGGGTTCFITGGRFCLDQELFWFFRFPEKFGGGQKYFDIVYWGNEAGIYLSK